jgi:sialidase-1
MLRAALALAALSSAAAALPTPIPVFTAARGGATYRIPALVRTAAGTLIAFAEQRTGGDCDSKSIVAARSEDGGRSWGPPAPVAGSPRGVTGNPTAVFDAVSGRVVLALASGGCNPAAATAVLDDGGSDGRAWGAPRVLPSLGAHSGALPGPGSAAQLPSGRLVFPAHFGAYVADIVVFSDDHGATWQVSPTLLPQMDEAAIAVVPGSNSSLVAAMRNNHLSPRRTVAWSASADAGATWSLPVTYDNPLLTPVCQASLVALEGALYFSGPRSTSARTNLTILRSTDGGASWGAAGFQVQAGSSNGYSCMASGSAVLPGLGGILFEGLGSIAFAHFPLDLGEAAAAAAAPA